MLTDWSAALCAVFLAVATALTVGTDARGQAATRDQPSARRPCAPVDEAASQPDFFSFRARLQQAVAARDAAAILAIVDPAIRISFGPDNGIDAFRRTWRLDQSDSPFWLEFGTVLSLGGSFDPSGRFVAPYTFRCGDDAFEDVVIVGDRVNVRAAPRSDAALIAAVGFEVVRGRVDSSTEGWAEIEVPGGRKGFVASPYVRSPIDYRVAFVRSRSGWQMELFVAGD